MDIDTMEYGLVRYGTPSNIYDLDELEHTVKEFQEILGKGTGLCFAVKANPFVADRMASLTGRLEICSPGEFYICREAGVPPEKMLISGVLKEKEELSEILDFCGGKALCSIESFRQLQIVSDWSLENRKKISILLRLTSGNQFGMSREELAGILSTREVFPYVEIRGLHYFSGTQKRSTEQIQKELKELDRVCMELQREQGFQIRLLEYGPGLPAVYFQGQKDIRRETLQEIRRTREEMEWQGELVLEMGRALAADCGVYAVRVRDMKRNEDRNYCIVDGGSHQMHYDGQIRGLYEPHWRVLQEDPMGLKEEWTVCGALCTSADVLIQKAGIRNLRLGDILVFQGTGAYSATEGMALFLSRDLPAVLLYSRDRGWRQVRERQQIWKWNTEEK